MFTISYSRNIMINILINYVFYNICSLLFIFYWPSSKSRKTPIIILNEKRFHFLLYPNLYYPATLVSPSPQSSLIPLPKFRILHGHMTTFTDLGCDWAAI